MFTRKGLALPRACHQIAMPGACRERSILAAAPVRFAFADTVGYLSFGPMAQCVVHALKGLACRARVTPKT